MIVALSAGSAFITVAPSLTGFSTKVSSYLKANLRAFQLDVVPNVDDAAAKAKLDEMARNRDSTLNVNADTAAAAAKYDVLARNRSSTLNIDADTTGAMAKITALKAAAGGIGGLFGVGSLIGGAIPLAGPLAAVLGGAGGAAGSALLGAGGASAAFGGSLIGNIKAVVDAQKDLTAAQAAAATAAAQEQSAQNAVANSMASLKSAEQGVADARIQAARNVASAQQGVVSAEQSLAATRVQATQQVAAAEQSLTQAQYTAKSAQDALNQARQTAQQQLKGLEDTLRGAALAESGSKLAVQQAEVNLRTVEQQKGHTRLQVLEAEQALKEARLAADQAATANTQAKRDAASARAAGVSGNAQVVAAQHNLAQANQGVTNSQQALTQARTQGAQAVAQAQLRVAAAETQLSQARTDGARSIARAQQQVASAQRSVAQAQQQAAVAGEAVAAAQQSIAAESKLLNSAPVQAFTKALAGLKDGFAKFLRQTAGASLGVGTKGLDLAAKLLPGLVPVANAAARAVGGLLDMFSNFATGPGGAKFMKFLTNFGSIFISQFGRIGLNVMKGLLHVFEAFGPLAKTFGTGLVAASRSFAQMTAHLGKSDGFKSFIAYVKDNGGKVVSILGDAARVIGRFVGALAPLGSQMLSGLAKLMGLLANAPTPVVLAFGAALAAIFSPAAGIALGVAGLITVLEGLYKTSPGFRKFTDGLNANLQGIDFAAVGKGFADTFGPLLPQLKDTFKSLVDVVSSFTGLVIEIWKRFGGDLKSFAKTYLSGVLDIINGLLKVIAGVFKLFTDLLKGNWSGMWKDLGQIAKGAGDILKGVLKVVWAQLKLSFTVGIKVLSTLWSGLWDGMKSVVSTAGGLLKTAVTGAINGVISVLNTLIEGINFLTKFVGIDAIPHIGNVGSGSGGNQSSGFSVPGGSRGQLRRHGYAQGGVLPGYTPGRDVHHFHSATGGALDLSGGEGILIPQAVRLLGGERGIKAINSKAQRFAGGGVWRPVAGGSMAGNGLHDQYTGFPALDFDVPVGTRVASVAPGRVSRSEDLISNGVFVSYGRVMQVMHNGFESLYAHLSKRGYNTGAIVNGGQIIAASGDTGNSTGPHLHFGTRGRSPYDFVNGATNYTLGSSKQRAAIGKFLGTGIGLPSIPNPLDYLSGKVSDALNAAKGALDSPFGQMLSKIPGKLASAAADKIGSFAASSLTGGTTNNVAQYGGVVAQVLNLLHQPSSLVGAVLARMQRESSGNPTAVNKWDSNWAAGTPSVGLMQVIGPTFRAYAGRFAHTGPFAYGVSENPEANIYAGLNYALHNYPSLGYAMGKPGGYDQGGLANGPGWMSKGPAPERVLNPQQTAAFERALNRNFTGSRDAVFNLYDKDNVLIGSMRGIAADEVYQYAAHNDALTGANA